MIKQKLEKQSKTENETNKNFFLLFMIFFALEDSRKRLWALFLFGKISLKKQTTKYLAYNARFKREMKVARKFKKAERKWINYEVKLSNGHSTANFASANFANVASTRGHVFGVFCVDVVTRQTRRHSPRRVAWTRQT